MIKPMMRRRPLSAHHALCAILTSILASLLLSACAGPAVPRHDVTIDWTEFGIPHIQAADFSSLGFGVGYAYARDNICLLAEATVTVRGERSRYFGADGRVAMPFGEVGNVDSDFFFRFYLANSGSAGDATVQPETSALLDGYAAGYNRYLHERGRDALPDACRGKPWVGDITAADLRRLLTQQAIQASGLPFLTAIMHAAPPASASLTSQQDKSISSFIATPPALGSNAYAFGRALTATGSGLLVANPHFPWQGTSRFYEMHLTIPGKLDVMGAALPPFPVVNIGFNKDVAWSHTVSTGKRFTLFQLTLAAGDPRSYLVDGKPEPMQVVPVEIDVTGADGKPTTQRHVFYMTRYGPVIIASDLGLVWNKETAFALTDANRANDRMVEQWLRIGEARTVGEIKTALAQVQGTPWVNTLAADRAGDVLYADFSVVPNLPDRKLTTCLRSAQAHALWQQAGIAVLDGSRSACAWNGGGTTSRTDIMPPETQPSLIRQDYVLNSNDSFWLANLQQPLTGYPQIIGRVDESQRWRTRLGYQEIERLTAGGRRQVTAGELEEMLFSNRNYAAGIVLDDFLPHCRELAAGMQADLLAACRILADWDRRDDKASRGAVLFREFWRNAQGIADLWQIPFDPAAPVSTPRQLNLGQAATRKALAAALRQAVAILRDNGFALDVALGDVQRWMTPARAFAIGGGEEFEGVLNELTFGPLSRLGYLPEPHAGSSYIQIVSWNADGPVADALLTYGQSSDPASRHSTDQIGFYSAKRLIRLPFTPGEIRAAGIQQTTRLTD